MPAPATPSPDGERRFTLPGPLDLVRTLSSLTFGPRDPRAFTRPDGFWMAVRTPDGPVTFRAFCPDAPSVAIQTWGPGSAWLLERAADLLGLHDPLEEFRPDHPLLARILRTVPGWRLPRLPLVLEALVPVIQGQLVTSEESFRSHRNLVLRYGDTAPGPIRLKVAPSAATLAALPSHAFTPLGFLSMHTRAVRLVASRANRMEEAASMPLVAAAQRLMAIPGIGPWTALSVLARTLGHADAVPTGDFHLPSLVSHGLAGEEEGDDRRMLELLEPFRPHRYRVVRLLMVGGPRRERRSPLPSIRPLPTEG
jgi:3-methyladenine DNA glycosylase/8-oxoguanine DNA glycosylase